MKTQFQQTVKEEMKEIQNKSFHLTVPLLSDEDGVVRVGGTRLRLLCLIAMFHSIPEIAEVVKAVNRRPCLIGIDGYSGAGKSTLARRLQERMRDATIVRKDDFYRVLDEPVRATLDAEQGYYLYFDWERLEQQVLQPLAKKQSACYQRYDWVTAELAETITIRPEGFVIVEGIYSTRPELRDYYDLRIWVQTSEAERMQRQISRNENTSKWIQRWAAAETFYVERFRPGLSANIIVAGE